jgi:hypothetical protein
VRSCDSGHLSLSAFTTRHPCWAFRDVQMIVGEATVCSPSQRTLERTCLLEGWVSLLMLASSAGDRQASAHTPSYSSSNPWLVNRSVRPFSVTVRMS